ncbi:MAG: glucose sorbosone dehydrogenase [Planctomycetaceae bacterium]|nr:glucose sorbosone dehydrogenase [Planctomycetaceae bacterium]
MRSLTIKTLALLAMIVATGATQAADLGVSIESAFPNLRIARPIVITHAGDGSNRIFVASQLGSIHVFEKNSEVEEAAVFFDHEEQVTYKDKENEEGLLGFAMHPNYKENGEFFLFYTTSDAEHTSVVSRFRVSKDDPNKADPTYEEELIRIPQPFWNHNGGTLAFGPDGYLYIALGDGGKGGDPLKNGQNLSTLNGSILRLDVDSKDDGKNYAIPASNPFVKSKGAKAEIYAYGFRNVWRLSFDRVTGTFYAADVGQKLWEEINIVKRGGNYGWNLREGNHPYVTENGEKGSGPRPDLIDPIFEYDHETGKSITGGVVYRGSAAPQLNGMYVYADYVSGRIWALEHDYKSGKVIANHEIPNKSAAGEKIPLITFGEDQDGEVYFSTQLRGGEIFKFKQN